MAMTATREGAEILALQALGWLAGDPERIERFLALSGLDPASLRDVADSPDTQRAVLDFLLADEALLLDFCEMAQIPPKQVSSSDKKSLRDLESDLKKLVFGQDRAIEELATHGVDELHVELLLAMLDNAADSDTSGV